MVPFFLARKEFTMIKTINAEKLVCVQLDVHLWGGRQALTRDYLIQSNPALAALPPAELASAGAVRICDPEETRVFQRCKAEAIRILKDNGLPILGAIGIPEARFGGVYQQLLRVQNEFETRAQDLLQRYDAQAKTWRDRWCQQHPAYAHLLGRLPDAQSVVGKLKFGFFTYSIQAPQPHEADHEANAAFDTQLKGLKGELLGDAAQEANELLTKYLIRTDGNNVSSPRDKITQKTMRPFKRIAAKLRSFAFIDPSC